MRRTQIYLTEEERAGLATLAATTGLNQSELVREAVDRFLSASSEQRRTTILNRAAGLWEERADLPDFSEMRRSWDRG